MFYFFLLLFEISVLFLLSRTMTKTLSKFLSINLLSFLFLPGVIIHELSHLLIAAVLLVPVGHMEFSPKKQEGGLKLGSIEIGKTDPIRRSIIGFAPVFVGLMIVVGIVYLFTSNILFFQDKNPYLFLAVILGIVYLLFAISNTMFSSSRDMEGTVETIVTLMIIVLLLYYLGLKVPISHVWIFLENNIDVVKKTTIFLLVPVLIDVIILGAIKIFRE